MATLGLPVALLLGWWASTHGRESFLLPSPATVGVALVESWSADGLLADVGASLARLAAGFALAAVLGVALGIAIGSWPGLRAVLEPVLELARAIPPPVLVPVLILLAGLGDTMKVLVIVSGCLWPVLLNTADGVRGIDPVLRDTAASYRLGRLSRLRHLLLPAAGPRIAVGARQALSIGLILMVISEMVAASDGLGFAIVQYQRRFAIPEMWSGIVVLGVIGVLLAWGLRTVERRALVWHHGTRQDLERAG